MDDAGARGPRRPRRGHRRRRRRRCWSATSTATCRSRRRARAHARHGRRRRRRCSRWCAARPPTGVGIDRLADFICEIGPSPARPPAASRSWPATPSSRGRARCRRASRSRSCSRRSPTRTSASVSLFKVLSGTVKPDDHLVERAHRRRRAAPRAVHRCGARSRTPVAEVPAGDIAAVAKLADTATGDTLAPEGHARSTCQPIEPPRAGARASRSRPARRPTRTSSATALHRLQDEDPALRARAQRRDPPDAAAGHGRDAPRDRARAARTASSASRSTPRTCRSRTARRSRGNAEAEGKYKKQTGGHGQFGVAFLRVEPLRAGRGLRVRRQDRRRRDPPPVHPRGREGHRGDDGARRRATASRSSTCRSRCFDGKYHSVDSSEMSFKMAGLARLQGGDGQGRRRRCSSRSRCSWSPCPTAYQGDVMGDLNARRGPRPGHRGRRRRRAGDHRARCRRRRSCATRSTCAR